jgi:hypothetical protein
MDTQTAAFVERRRTAQRAGTIGLDNDPLIVAVRQQWQDTQDVMARMRAYRAAEAAKVSTTAKV